MAEEIVFTTRVDTGNSVSAINNVDKALKNVDNTIKETSTDSSTAFDNLNKKVESGELSVRQLTKAVKEYATIAVQAGEDSVIGQEAIRRAGQLKDRLGDLQTQINANANDGRNMQTALQLGQGIASGYAVAQGAMALFGSESKDLQKTLVKLQAIQALLVGLEEIRAILEKESLVRLKATQIWNKVKIASEYAYTTAIGTSTGALKLARIAMLALPIIAIIAGLVAIAGAMGAFSSSTNDANIKQQRLNANIDKQINIIERRRKSMNNDLEFQLAYQKAIGMSDETILENKKKGVAELIEEDKKIIEKDKKKLKNLRAVNLGILAGSKEEFDALVLKNKKEQYEIIGHMNEKYAIIKDLNNALKIETAQFDTDEKDKSKSSSKNKIDNSKKTNDELLTLEKARLLNLKSLENDFLIELEQAETEYYDSLLSKRQKDEQDVNDYYFNLITKAEQAGKDTSVLKQAQAQKIYLINKEYTDKELEDKKNALDIQSQAEEDFYATYQETINTEQENEINSVNEKYFLLIETAKQYGLDTVELERQRQEQIDKIQEASTLKKIDDVKKYSDAVMSSLNALSELQNQLDANKLKNSNLTEKQIHDIKRKAFDRDKALKIASVGVNTAEAISKSVALSPATFGAPFSIFAGITGLAQIAAISNTKFDGGGSSINAPTVPSGGGSESPQSNGSQVGGTSQVSGVGLMNNATGLKVTVVDSEIKAVMDASTQANVLSTFGG